MWLYSSLYSNSMYSPLVALLQMYESLLPCPPRAHNLYTVWPGLSATLGPSPNVQDPRPLPKWLGLLLNFCGQNPTLGSAGLIPPHGPKAGPWPFPIAQTSQQGTPRICVTKIPKQMGESPLNTKDPVCLVLSVPLVELNPQTLIDN